MYVLLQSSSSGLGAALEIATSHLSIILRNIVAVGEKSTFCPGDGAFCGAGHSLLRARAHVDCWRASSYLSSWRLGLTFKKRVGDHQPTKNGGSRRCRCAFIIGRHFRRHLRCAYDAGDSRIYLAMITMALFNRGCSK